MIQPSESSGRYPATVPQLAWWAGLKAKEAKAAAAALGLVALDPGDQRLMFADDREALLAARAPPNPVLSLVGCLDNLSHPRRDAQALLGAGDEELDLSLGQGGKAGASLADFEVHPIIDRGRLVGLWDYDGEAGALALSGMKVRS